MMLFLNFLQLEAGPVEGQSLQQKDKRRRKEKAKKNIKKNTEKPKDVGHFVFQKLSQNFDFWTCLL